MRLCLRAEDLEAVRAAAAAAFPEECCGLLIGAATGAEDKGDALRVARVIAAANAAPEPRRRFEVEPAALFAAHKGARAAGEAVIGHYHSHPGGAAVPSAHDKARAFGEGEVWLIVPVDGSGAAGAARAHLFEGGAFREIEIALAP